MCVGKPDRAAYTLSSSVFISPCLKLMAIKAISSQFHGDSQSSFTCLQYTLVGCEVYMTLYILLNYGV